MYCLTWHGTVLRRDLAHGRLIHGLPWPVRGSAVDWRVALPDGGLQGAPAASADDPDLWFVPSRTAGIVHLRRGDAFLCAARHTGEALFNRGVAGAWESFLLLNEDALARLRRMLGWCWAEAGDGEASQPRLGERFKLRVGTCELDLRLGVPAIEPGGGNFTDTASGRHFHAVAPVPQGRETSLRRRHSDQQAPLVAGAASFAASPNSRFNITGERDYGFLPLAACRADQDWMQERWLQGGPRRLGPQVLACQAVREHDKYVLLNRWREGTVFDGGGASNETGYLMGMPLNQQDALRREGDDVYIANEALDSAPYLAGPHAVFYGGNLSNYYHWVIDALLPLHALAPYLPAGTKLLIPGTLRAFREGPREIAERTVDHMEALREWGFGDLPMVEVAAPVCHVEEVYWLDPCGIEHMPARLVKSARESVLARLPAAGAPARNRIYMRRRGMRGVINDKPIERLALNNGFVIHEMEGMTPREQIELFRDAEFVIAPHGAGLANLMFCAPGTKVIELSPDSEFRPLFAQISDKLDLVHGVMPCSTDTGEFHGRMTVDVEKLRMLLRQMLFMPQPA